jgi:SAM-dependent methyltransferase
MSTYVWQHDLNGEADRPRLMSRLLDPSSGFDLQRIGVARAGPNLDMAAFDVVHDEPPGAPFELVAIRALLHHLPERRAAVSRMVRWLKPGGWLFVQEPDFYPTLTVEPPSKKSFWEAFIRWADAHQIDDCVGRKLSGWMQQEGLAGIVSEGHILYYYGGSDFARWWDYGLRRGVKSTKSCAYNL